MEALAGQIEGLAVAAAADGAATNAAAAAAAGNSGASSASASASARSASSRLLNVNIGILGHVDSGKTSLAKALSTLLSTASLDKLPQSQERGITLDLGFSAFFIPVPEHLKDRYDQVQVTLVDCPGHASLIRTIIGGAGIIDLMLLVVDATKGIQTQTAECLVIGEILTERMMVVLNKTDLLTEPERQLPKIDKQMRAVFAQTKFGKDVTIVPVAANPNSAGDLKVKEGKEARNSAAAATGAAAAPDAACAPRVAPLLAALSAALADPPRRTHGDSSSPFLFAVDHCFQIKGQGTVLTGTVLSGSVRVNQVVELPHLGLERKVKSMQRFRQAVESAAQGDRVGICVTQLDSKLVERGLLCTPRSVQPLESVIAVVDKVRFYKGAVANKSKFHVSIGHATAMATVHFFGGPDRLPGQSAAAAGTAAAAATSSAARPASASSSSSAAAASPPAFTPTATRVAPVMQFDFDREYAWRDELLPVSADVQPYTQFAVLEFEKPVLAPLQSVLLGSRLDADIHLNSCRIAFQGRLLAPIQWSSPAERARLRVVKHKERVGVIDRLVDGYTLIGRDLFSKGTDMALFVGKSVELEDGTRGVIDGPFGQGGKFKATFSGGLPLPAGAAGGGAAASGASAPDSAAAVAAAKKSKAKVGTLKGKIYLRFKKYMYALDKKAMVQTATPIPAATSLAASSAADASTAAVSSS